jgi:hypothetical protein
VRSVYESHIHTLSLAVHDANAGDQILFLPSPLATTTAALCSAVAHSDQHRHTDCFFPPSQSLPCAEATTHRPGSELQRPPATAGAMLGARPK